MRVRARILEAALATLRPLGFGDLFDARALSASRPLGERDRPSSGQLSALRRLSGQPGLDSRQRNALLAKERNKGLFSPFLFATDVRLTSLRQDRLNGLEVWTLSRWMSCSRHAPTLTLAMFSARNRIRLDASLGKQRHPTHGRNGIDTTRTPYRVSGRTPEGASFSRGFRTRENEPG